MPTRLPLFPLGAVMVPGLVMPLHVVEPRFGLLVRALEALPEQAPRLFGVVAVRDGHEPTSTSPGALHAVGCTADLRDVTDLGDGRYDVVAVGQGRFTLLGLDDDAGTPYPTGLVDLLEDHDGADDLTGALAAVAREFAAYRAALGVGPAELPDDPAVVSYLVAAAAVLPLAVRQQLLEAPTTAARLGHERRVLRGERRIVERIRSVPAVDLPHRPVPRN